MNGFRIAILTLLVLVVGLLFYVVIGVLPNQKKSYDLYVMSKNTPTQQTDVDDADASAAPTEADERLRRLREEQTQTDEQSLAEEERRTVALAEEQRRRESEAAMADQLDDEAAQAPLGLVTGVAPSEGFLSFKPMGKDVISKGLIVAVRRGESDYVICEAEVDYLHEESGEYIANIREQDFSSSVDKDSTEKLIPAVGDQVIISPFASAQQLRADNPFLKPDPPSVPSGADNEIPES
ncbi:MAG: hypothetical protein Q4A24_03045 [Akkermansia sp.]|nr:hypothetical protein [Akkermansia sp.]